MKKTLLALISFTMLCQAQTKEKGFGHARIIQSSCDTVWSALGPWALQEQGSILVAGDRQAGLIGFRSLADSSLISLSVEDRGKSACSVRVLATGLSGLSTGTLDILLVGIETHIADKKLADDSIKR
jgi:hypothetical protein